MFNFISKMLVASCGFTIMIGTISQSFALPLEELKKYDKNDNDMIDPGEEESIYFLHLRNQVMRKFDINPLNGRLDPAEVAAIQNAGDIKLGAGYSETQMDEARLDLKLGKSRDIRDLADPPAPLAKKREAAQRLFLRKNRLNISVYNKSIDKSAADGAELSFSRNETSDNNQFQATGFTSYVLGRNTRVPRPKGNSPNDLFLSGYASAFWTEFDYLRSTGNPASERSKLIFGLDNQFEIFGGNLFGVQVINLSPSYQTDFDLDGRIYGAEASWQPYNTKIALGSYQAIPNTPIGFTWLAQADTLYQYVDNAGKTNLDEGANYWWIGGALDATLWFYPERLDRKLYAKFNLLLHYDQNSGAEALQFSSSLNYNLDQQGITSVSIGYEDGEDYKTGKKRKQFTVGLKIKH